MTACVPACLILSVKDTGEDENEQPWMDEDICLHVSDYVMLPAGSTMTFYDGDFCLFEDAVVAENHVNNRHGGLLVEVSILPTEWHRLIRRCRKIAGYVSNEYPQNVSFFRS
jgi:hypothetical protein